MTENVEEQIWHVLANLLGYFFPSEQEIFQMFQLYFSLHSLHKLHAFMRTQQLNWAWLNKHLTLQFTFTRFQLTKQAASLKISAQTYGYSAAKQQSR